MKNNQKQSINENLKNLKQEGVKTMNSQNQKNQANNNLNSNQEGVEPMWKNNNPKNYKIHDENGEKVELFCHFIDDRENIFGEYIWVPKTAITENGLDEKVKKSLEEDVAWERKREYVQLFWIEEERQKSEDDDEDDISFFIIG